MIRSAKLADAEAVARIYNHYIENTVVSFEEKPVSVDEMHGRMEEKLAAYPWLVVEDGGEVMGYAYAGKWNTRCAYRFAAECSVYLDHEHLGKGNGSRLYSALLDELRARSVHCVIGGVALPNPASVALHEKFGFEKVAHYRDVSGLGPCVLYVN